MSSYVLSDEEKGVDNESTIDKVKKILIEKQNVCCNICNCDLKLGYSSNDRQQFSIDRMEKKTILYR